MRRANAQSLNNNSEDETHSHPAAVQLTDACKRASIQHQNHGLPSAIICGSASSMCANTTNLGIIMRGYKAPRLKLKSDALPHGNDQAGNLPLANQAKTVLTTHLDCLILKTVTLTRRRVKSPLKRRAWKILNCRRLQTLI